MEFNPKSKVIQLCLKGMAMDEKGEHEEASKMFVQAWTDASYPLEKFIAAYNIAKHEKHISEKLKWYEKALQLALAINDNGMRGAIGTSYSNIANCYDELGDKETAKKNYQLAISFSGAPSDKGPFYHGTKANLQVGDVLTAGRMSNYKDDLQMNHIYFTALASGAGLAAALAKGEGHGRVYVVEPTGSFENDPNVTDKKFPGNLTRSYRTTAPLKVIGEIADWEKQSQEDVQKWRDKLANSNGEIIN